MYASPRERAASALAAFVIVLAIAFMLIFGLRVATAVRESGALVSVLLRPSPPPPPPKTPKAEPRKMARPAPKDATSPRNLRNQATPVVAPRVVPLILPPPVVVATQAGTGQAASTGASDQAGPGQGAGGIGNGTGGGGNGGGGSDGQAAVGPRQVRGRLSFSDMPDGLLGPGTEARVGVRYTIDATGRVSACHVDEPSGYPVLDALTCRLIERRFRFRPARDEAGHAVSSQIVEGHTWFVPPEEDRRRS